jgi:O-antigen ligase
MPLLGLAAGAAALPSLLAYNVAPSPTFLNQALALLLWAVFVIAAAPAAPGRGPWAPWLALTLVAAGVLGSWGPGALPSSLALSALALLAAAALLLAAGAGSRRRADPEALFAAFCGGWVAAGLANMAVALVQVFQPGWADGDWIAASGMAGRAVGNLRQPNHLSSLLTWAAIASVGLAAAGRLRHRHAGVLVALFVFGIVLTASRTGLVSVLLLALWGAADRRLAWPTRALLFATPLVYVLAWFGMAQWAALASQAFGGSARLATDGDLSSSRFAIWSNTLELIRREPWLGVGFGEFNLAWTLTPFPKRPTAYFDHTHNLPLQLAVELGLPLALAITALLLWALVQGHRSAGRTPGPAGAAQRTAMLMVLTIGLHSLLEYPLWYSYFLLPAAWAWGFALAGAGSPQPQDAVAPRAAAPPAPPPARAVAGVAALLAAGALLSVADYLRVAAIFAAPDDAAPLSIRIASGRRSAFFAHHADYAAVTTSPPSAGSAGAAEAADTARSFASTTPYLLDARLMIAWAEWLDAQGRHDEARHLAARLREFGKPDAEEFFAPCEDAASAAAAFQCQAPARTLHWREFLR